VGISFIPNFQEIELTPDHVLIGLLPPLLYAAAIRTSLIDFRANRRAIGLLSVGLVAFSTLVVGVLTWWVVPGVAATAAFALGAVVSPPDPVAATTVTRRVGLPRRIRSILEGEGLVNDATALVALNAALAAMSTRINPAVVTWELVRVAGGGLLIGLVVALTLSQIRRRTSIDPVIDTTLSLAAPYVAFLPAEKIHASGVLADVVAGLVLGHRAPIDQSARSRISENVNWRTVQFLLESAVFLLIGLQLRRIITHVSAGPLPWTTVLGACFAVLSTTIAARAVYVFGVAGLLRLLRQPSWTPAECTVVSWAGLRGVVTLAAVFIIPSPDTQRSLLALLAFTVVAGTLLLHGLTLPWLVRRMRLTGPGAADDALQAATLITEAVRAGLEELDKARGPDDREEVLGALRERAMRRSNQAWERLGRSQQQIEPPTATYRRLRLRMLDGERRSILAARDRGVYDDEVLRTALAAIDTEESTLDRIEDAVARVDDELVSESSRAGDCTHLREAPRVIAPSTPEGCEECLREGTRWVHLRLCLSCGHVGCCDSSVGRHATVHFHGTGHPVIRSLEPGEAWRWCYLDELLD
jgi:CPA1 family monovalent cation:H+ antiporter